MSFTKAKIKRFNDIDDDVPPVGSYDPKCIDSGGSCKLMKSEKLKHSRDNLASSLPLMKDESNVSARKCLQFKTPICSRSSYHLNYIRNQEYEKEIRRLLKERSDLLKQIALKEDEMKKLHAKLQIAIRERSHLQANAIVNEKETKELRRINEVLKIKVATLESVDKTKGKGLKAELADIKGALIVKEHKITDLSEELETIKKEHSECVETLIGKDNEIAKMSTEMTETIKNLEVALEQAKEESMQLQAEKNTLVECNEEIFIKMHSLEEKILLDEDTIRELMNHKDDLNAEVNECHQELENKQQLMTKTVEDLRKENISLLMRMEEQTSKRLSCESNFSNELENVQQNLATTEDCTRSLQEYRDALIDKVTVLKKCVKDYEEQQLIDMKTIKELKEQLLETSSQLANKEQTLLDANVHITSLNDKIIELKSVQKNVKTLAEKCSMLENELACYEADSKVEHDKWEAEILLSKLACDVVEQELCKTQQKVIQLQSELDEEKEKCKNLNEDLTSQKDTAAAKETQLLELVAEANSVCHIKNEEIIELQNQILTKSSEITLLKDKLECEITNKEKLREVIQVKLEEFSALNERLHIAEEEKLIMDNNVAALTLKLNTNCEENEGKVIALEKELTSLKMKTKNQKCEITKLLEKVLFFKEQLNCCRDAEVVAKKALVTLKKEKAEILSSLDGKDLEIKNIRESFAANEKILEQTLKEKEESVKCCLKLEERICNMELTVNEQIKLLEDAKVTNSKMEDLENQLLKTEEKKSYFENALIEANSTLNVLHEEMNSKLSKVETELKMFKDKNEENETEIKKLEEEKKYWESVCLELKENVCKWEKQCFEKDRLYEEVNIELHTHKEWSATLLSDCESNKVVLNEVKERNIALENQLDDASRELLNAKERLLMEIQNYNELNIMLNDKVKEGDEMGAKLKAAEEEINCLTMQVQNSATTKMDLENALEKLKTVLADSQSNFSVLECEMKDKISLLDNQFILEKNQRMNFENKLLETNDKNILLNAMLEEKNRLVDKLHTELEQQSKKIAEAEHCITNLELSLEKRCEEISELQTVIETNHHLIIEAHDNSVVEGLRNTTQQLEDLYKTYEEQSALLQEIHSEKKKLELCLKEMETEKEMHMAQLEWYSNREKDLLQELDIVEERALLKQEEYTRVLRETQKQLGNLENETENYKLRKENEGRQNEQMLQALTTEYESHTRALSQQLENSTKETLHWKTLFEKLQLKVAPFQEQLDAYEVERNVLMSKNNETLSDFTKLSHEFATLLGHQNHKQKIRYVNKLKEENLSLKEENTKLWTEVLKLRKAIHRKDVANISTSIRKFDPKKAFQHFDKENDPPS